MPKGMALEELVLELVVDQLCWCVVVTLYLVADHLYLLVDLLLRILTVEDDIRQEVDGLGEVLLRYSRIKHSILLVGKGVQLATHTLQSIDHLQGTAMLRTFEGHVLTEMRKSLFARQFVARADSQVITTPHHL